MKQKRLLALIMCFVMTFILYPKAAPDEAEGVDGQTNTLSVSSENYILVNMDDGEVLLEKNSDVRKYPASTTKIMTAILAIENLDMEAYSQVSNYAVMSISWDSSKLGLYEGESFRNIDLINGMMVASGNDAANVLAEAVSGSVDAFVELMNKKADELGLKGTHFSNPHGLTDENHYTTPEDMAKIACYAMKNETFREAVKMTSFELPATEKCSDRRYFINTNNMLTKERTGDYYYSLATGIKTGYTDAALHCLVGSAEKDGVRLISVVLGASNINGVNMSYPDTKALFEWGFENYENTTLVKTGQIADEKAIKYAKGAKTAKLIAGSDFSVLSKKGEDISSLETKVSLDAPLKAPITEGEKVGVITVSLNGEKIGEVDLTVDKNYEYSWSSAFFSSMGKIVGIFAAILLAAVVILIIIRQVEYEKRRKERMRKRAENSGRRY